jgi:cell division protein FtsL
MTPAVASVYRLFKRADGKPESVRMFAIVMVALACALCAFGIVRVARQHEVLRLGYQLSRESDTVRELREARRRLELEHATLTSPDRIRRLATQLGMTPVSPDRIRVIEAHHKLAELR